MDGLGTVIVYSFLSGITVFLGGLLANVFENKFQEGLAKEQIIHTLIAFGGGIIVAAVAFVLVPRGIQILPMFQMVVVFLAGAISFFFLDRAIARKGGSISQLLAMLMDFIPEAIALGAVFATDENLGLLLALFIGLQNLPESFNSYIDLRSIGYNSKKCLTILFLLSFSGVLASITGHFFLSERPELCASLMMFSSGGILYLIFEDISPMAKMQKSRLPALGANFGFLVGMIGQKLLG